MYWYIIYATCPKEDTRNRRNRGNEETRRRRNEETKKRTPTAEAIGGKNQRWMETVSTPSAFYVDLEYFFLIPHGAEVFSSLPRFVTILYVQYVFFDALNIFFDPLPIFFLILLIFFLMRHPEYLPIWQDPWSKSRSSCHMFVLYHFKVGAGDRIFR